MPYQAVREATEQLKSLPFAIGEREEVGRKIDHTVTLELAPRAVASNAPEEEKGKHTMRFLFGRYNGMYETGHFPIQLNTHKDLSVVQERDKNGDTNNVIRFSPDQPLNIAGKEVREVALVTPVNRPEWRR